MTTKGNGQKTTQNTEASREEAEQRPIFMLYGFMVLLVLLALIGFRLSTANFLEPQAVNVVRSDDEVAQPEEKTTDAAQAACTKDAFGPGRAVKIDSTSGPQFGLVQYPDTLPLKEGEVVFTFDDGPHPKRTPQILDILDKHCIKAVFFMIGKMAQEHPEMVREVARRGHVIAAHTWSHPLRLTHFSRERAEAEIEHGFMEVNQALGRPIAPFFRFPGLIHSKKLLDYLGERNISVWSTDVVAGDTERRSRHHLAATVKRRLADRGQGILLFHDVKQVTIDNLEKIIEDLKDAGYHPAHVVPVQTYAPLDKIAQLPDTKQLTAKKQQASTRRHKRRWHGSRRHRRKP